MATAFPDRRPATMVGLLLLLLAGTVHGCTIPQNLRGSWVQYGYPNNSKVLISPSDMQGKGRCVVGDVQKGQFVMYRQLSSDEGNFICYTCVLITRRSENILQYKETHMDSMTCEPASNAGPLVSTATALVDRICSGVGLDETLHTLVRENALPVACPFHGLFTVEYSKHHGKMCRATPASMFEHCASDTQQKWSLRRCPDDLDNDDLNQEVQCLGSWHDGDSWFYVKYSNDYRCIRYKNIQGDQLQLFISDDSSCTSVSADRRSPWILKLTNAARTSSSRRSSQHCSFPGWFTSKAWHDVTGSIRYELGGQRISHLSTPTPALVASVLATSLRWPAEQALSRNVTVSRTTCVSSENQRADNHQLTERYVVSVLEGCTSQFQCLLLRRLATNVALMRKGKAVTRPGEACSYGATSEGVTESHVLFASKEPVSCPFKGQFHAVYPQKARVDRCQQSPVLWVGCSSPASVLLAAACPNVQDQHFECLGSWETPEANHVIVGTRTRATGSTPTIGACYIYSIGPTGNVHLKWDAKCSETVFNKTVDRGLLSDELSLRLVSSRGTCAQMDLEFERPAIPSQHTAPSRAAALSYVPSSQWLFIFFLLLTTVHIFRDRLR